MSTVQVGPPEPVIKTLDFVNNNEQYIQSKIFFIRNVDLMNDRKNNWVRQAHVPKIAILREMKSETKLHRNILVDERLW